MTGPPSIWHQSRRLGRSSALPYPPGWYYQDRNTGMDLQEENKNIWELILLYYVVEPGIIVVADREL